MLFWHWAKYTSDSKLKTKRYHGLQLNERWNGSGDIPISRVQPTKGLPALETNHPFHIKMSPSLFLGPTCNHDVASLLRMPNRTNMSEADTITGMLEALGDYEYYCASYAGKEQPHIDGLLHTLADGIRSKQRDIAEAKERNELIEDHEAARQLLHRLMSSTNRRMHKGFPEMLTYLLKKKMEYCSHEFVHLSVLAYTMTAEKVIKQLTSGVNDYQNQSKTQHEDKLIIRLPTKKYLDPFDYKFRPEKLEEFPLYFFIAATSLEKSASANTLDWKILPHSKGRFYRGPAMRP